MARFSRSSAKARFSPSRPAKQNVIQRMPGARSTVLTAVGSRAKLKIASTSAVKASEERNAVRLRNSSRRSLDATIHASRSRSATGRRLVELAVGGGVAALRPVFHESARHLDRHVGGEIETLVQVVRHQHDDAVGGAQPLELLSERS